MPVATAVANMQPPKISTCEVHLKLADNRLETLFFSIHVVILTARQLLDRQSLPERHAGRKAGSSERKQPDLSDEIQFDKCHQVNLEGH